MALRRLMSLKQTQQQKVRRADLFPMLHHLNARCCSIQLQPHGWNTSPAPACQKGQSTEIMCLTSTIHLQRLPVGVSTIMQLDAFHASSPVAGQHSAMCS